MIDHDELFKKLLTTFFIEFIELFLPSVAEYLDRDAIAFLPQEYFTDTTTGDRRPDARRRDNDSLFGGYAQGTPEQAGKRVPQITLGNGPRRRRGQAPRSGRRTLRAGA